MDCNLTGALAANISLMQSGQAYLVQFLTAIIAPLGVLGGVWLTNRHQRKEKQDEFERIELQKMELQRKEAYVDFLEIFSKPIIKTIKRGSQRSCLMDPVTQKQIALTDRDITRVDDITPYLKVALRIREFGNLLLRDLQLSADCIHICNKDAQIRTLDDVIKSIIELRCGNRFDELSPQTTKEFEDLRILTVKRLSTELISSFNPKKQEEAKSKSRWPFWRRN